MTRALADPRLDPMPFLRQALPRGLHAPRGLAPIYRTAMGLGADGADGWDASKVTGLRWPRIPFRRCALYHVSTEAKMASTTSVQ